jgi:hypothetical protein
MPRLSTRYSQGLASRRRRTMAQSMVMLTQILDNPQIQQSLAEINEEYIDFKPIINMWLEASEWKNKQDIIKPMTKEMKAKRDANSKAALMQQQVQAKQARSSRNSNRSNSWKIRRPITVSRGISLARPRKTSGLSEAVSGTPNPQACRAACQQ